MDRRSLVRFSFHLGLKYSTILCMLAEIHGEIISLSTLKRTLNGPRFVPTKISIRSFECCNVHRGQDINHRKSTRIQVDAPSMPTGWNDGFEGHREF